MNLSTTWPVDKARKLAEMWLQGKSVAQIRVALGGLTRNAVIGKAHRLGLRGRHFSSKPADEIEGLIKNIELNRWTAEEDVQLKVLAARQFSPSEIAAELGISRRRVALRAKRIGVRIVRQKRARTSYVRRDLRDQKKQNIPDNGLLGNSAIFAGIGMSLLKVGAYQCRWPLDGHGPDGMPRCCGDKIDENRVYCVEHARKAYRDDPKSSMEAA